MQADPIGLALAGSKEAVNHLFLYADAGPITRTDRRGLLATRMCGPTAIEAIKMAIAEIDNVDLSECVTCDIGFTAKKLKQKLTNMTVNCLEAEEQVLYGITSDVCATAAKPSYSVPYKLIETGSDVTVVPNGLQGSCGCLAQVLLHEAGHLAAGRGSGGDTPIHKKITDMAKGCIPCS